MHQTLAKPNPNFANYFALELCAKSSKALFIAIFVVQTFPYPQSWTLTPLSFCKRGGATHSEGGQLAAQSALTQFCLGQAELRCCWIYDGKSSANWNIIIGGSRSLDSSPCSTCFIFSVVVVVHSHPHRSVTVPLGPVMLIDLHTLCIRQSCRSAVSNI